MEIFDWSSFEVATYISCPKSEVYKRLATVAGMNSWFRRETYFLRPDQTHRAADEFAEAGDHYEWAGYAQSQLSRGHVFLSRRDEAFGFTFRGDLRITITLAEVPGGTRLSLHQENIPVTEIGRINEHLSCKVGWGFFLINLKSVLEGGVDLRERDPDRSKEDLINT